MEQLKAQAAKEIAELDAAVKIQVAQISAQNAIDTASLSAQAAAANQVTEELSPDNTVIDAIKGISERVDALHAHATAPRKIVRDAEGRATGVDIGGIVKPITRGVDGRMEGL